MVFHSSTLYIVLHMKNRKSIVIDKGHYRYLTALFDRIKITGSATILWSSFVDSTLFDGDTCHVILQCLISTSPSFLFCFTAQILSSFSDPTAVSPSSRPFFHFMSIERESGQVLTNQGQFWTGVDDALG